MKIRFFQKWPLHLVALATTSLLPTFSSGTRSATLFLETTMFLGTSLSSNKDFFASPFFWTLLEKEWPTTCWQSPWLRLLRTTLPSTAAARTWQRQTDQKGLAEDLAGHGQSLPRQNPQKYSLRPQNPTLSHLCRSLWYLSLPWLASILILDGSLRRVLERMRGLLKTLNEFFLLLAKTTLARVASRGCLVINAT